VFADFASFAANSHSIPLLPLFISQSIALHFSFVCHIIPLLTLCRAAKPVNIFFPFFFFANIFSVYLSIFDKSVEVIGYQPIAKLKIHYIGKSVW